MLPLLCAVSKQATVAVPARADADDLGIVAVVSSEDDRSSSGAAPATMARNLLRFSGSGFVGASATMAGTCGGLEPLLSPDGGTLLLHHAGAIEFRAQWDGYATGIRRSLCASCMDGHADHAEEPPLGRVLSLRGGGLARVFSPVPSRRHSIARWTPDSKFVVSLVVGPEQHEGGHSAPSCATLFVHDSHGNELLVLSTAWAHVVPLATALDPTSAAPLADDVRDAVALWHCLAPSSGLCDFSVIDSFTFDAGDEGTPRMRAAASIAILGDDGFVRLVAVSWSATPVHVATCDVFAEAATSRPGVDAPGPQSRHPPADVSRRRTIPWLRATALGVHSLAGAVSTPSCMSIAPWPPSTVSKRSRAAVPVGDAMLPSTFVLVAVGGSLDPALHSLQPPPLPPHERAGAPAVPPAAQGGVVFLRLEIPVLCVGVLATAHMSRLPDTGVGVLGWHALWGATAGFSPPREDYVVRSLPGDATLGEPRPLFGSSVVHANLALMARLPPAPPGYDNLAALCGPRQMWTGTDAGGPDGRWSALCCAPCSLARRVGTSAHNAVARLRCCRRRGWTAAASDAAADAVPLRIGDLCVAAIVPPTDGDEGSSDSAEDDACDVQGIAAARVALPLLAVGVSFQGLDPSWCGATVAPPLLAVLGSDQRLALWHLRSVPPSPRQGQPSPQSPRRPQRDGADDDYDDALVAVDRVKVATELVPYAGSCVRSAQWYALDCIALGCVDGQLRFFGLEVNESSSLVALPLAVWRRPPVTEHASRGTQGSSRAAIAGAGDGGGVVVLSCEEGLGPSDFPAPHATQLACISRARLTSLQQLEASVESGERDRDGLAELSMTDTTGDAQRSAAYWRHAATGAPMSASALDELVLGLTLSRHAACFALAIAVQGGTVAQLLFVASRHESRGPQGLTAAGTLVPPADLPTATTLLQAGLVALQELLQPPLPPSASEAGPAAHCAAHIGSRVKSSGIELSDLLTTALRVQALAHGVAMSAPPEHIAALQVPVQVLVLCAGLLAARAARLVQYAALRAATGVAVSTDAVFFRRQARGVVQGRLQEDCAALEFRWFALSSGVELIRSCLLPRDVWGWACRESSASARDATLEATPYVLSQTPQALLKSMLRTVPATRAVFVELFFAVWSFLPHHSLASVVTGLELLLECGNDADVPGLCVHPVTLLSIFSPEDPEFSLFLSTNLAMFASLEATAIRKARQRGDAQTAVVVLTSTRAALTTLCLEHGSSFFSGSADSAAYGSHVVQDVLRWIAATLSGLAEADTRLASQFSCACALVAPHDRPALLAGAVRMAAELRFVQSLGRAFPADERRRSSIAAPALAEWFDSDVSVRGHRVAALCVDGFSFSEAWSVELLHALRSCADAPFCWSLLFSLAQVAAASPQDVQGESSGAAMRLFGVLAADLIPTVAPERPAHEEAMSLLRLVTCTVLGCPLMASASSTLRDDARNLLDVAVATATELCAPNPPHAGLAHTIAALIRVVDASEILSKYVGAAKGDDLRWSRLCDAGRQSIRKLVETDEQSAQWLSLVETRGRGCVPTLALFSAATSVSNADAFLEDLLDAGPTWASETSVCSLRPKDLITTMTDVLQLRSFFEMGLGERQQSIILPSPSIVSAFLRNLLRGLSNRDRSLSHQATIEALRAFLLACCRRGAAQSPPALQWVARRPADAADVSMFTAAELDLVSQLSDYFFRFDVEIPPPSAIFADLVGTASSLLVDDRDSGSRVARCSTNVAVVANVMGAAQLLSAFAEVDALSVNVYALSARLELQGLADFSRWTNHLGRLLSLAAPVDVSGNDFDSASSCGGLLDWAAVLPGSVAPVQASSTPRSVALEFDGDSHPLWKHWLVCPSAPGLDLCDVDADGTDAEYRLLLRGDDGSDFSINGQNSVNTGSAVSRLLANVGDFAGAFASVTSKGDATDRFAVTQAGADTLLAAGHVLGSMLRGVPNTVIAVSGAVAAPETATAAAQTAVSTLVHHGGRLLREVASAVDGHAVDDFVDRAPDESALCSRSQTRDENRAATCISRDDPGALLLSCARNNQPAVLFETLKNLPCFRRDVASSEARLWSASLIDRPRDGAAVLASTGLCRVDPLGTVSTLWSRGSLSLPEAIYSCHDAIGESVLGSSSSWNAICRSSTAALSSFELLAPDAVPRFLVLSGRMAATENARRSDVLRTLSYAAGEAIRVRESELASLYFSAMGSDAIDCFGLNSELQEEVDVVAVRLSLALTASVSSSPLIRIGVPLFAVLSLPESLVLTCSAFVALITRRERVGVSLDVQLRVLEFFMARLSSLRERTVASTLGESSTSVHRLLCRISAFPVSVDEAERTLAGSAAAVGDTLSEALSLALNAGIVAGVLASEGCPLSTDFGQGDAIGDGLSWTSNLEAESALAASMIQSAITTARREQTAALELACLVSTWATACTLSCAISLRQPDRAAGSASVLSQFFDALLSVARRGTVTVAGVVEIEAVLVDVCRRLPLALPETSSLSHLVLSSAGKFAALLGLPALQAAFQGTSVATMALSHAGCSVNVPALGMITCLRPQDSSSNAAGAQPLRLAIITRTHRLESLAGPHEPDAVLSTSILRPIAQAADALVTSSSARVLSAQLATALVDNTPLDRMPELITALPSFDAARQLWWSYCHERQLGRGNDEYATLDAAFVAESAVYSHLMRCVSMLFDEHHSLMLAALVCRLGDSGLKRVALFVSRSNVMFPQSSGSSLFWADTAVTLVGIRHAALLAPGGALWTRALLVSVRDAAASLLGTVDLLPSPISSLPASLGSCALELSLLRLEELCGAAAGDRLLEQSALDTEGSVDIANALGPLPVSVARCLAKRSLRHIRDMVTSKESSSPSEVTLAEPPPFLAAVGALDHLSCVARIFCGDNVGSPSETASDSKLALQLFLSQCDQATLEARAVHALKSLFFRLLSEGLAVRVGRRVGLTAEDMSVGMAVPLASGAVPALVATVARSQSSSLATFLSLLCRDTTRLADSARRLWRSIPRVSSIGEPAAQVFSGCARALGATLLAGLLGLGFGGPEDVIVLELLRISAAFFFSREAVDGSFDRSVTDAHTEYAASLLLMRKDLDSEASRVEYFLAVLQRSDGRHSWDGAEAAWLVAHRVQLLTLTLACTLVVWGGETLGCCLDAFEVAAASASGPLGGDVDTPDSLAAPSQSSAVLALSALAMLTKKSRTAEWDAEAVAMLVERVRAPILASRVPLTDSFESGPVLPRDTCASLLRALIARVASASSELLLSATGSEQLNEAALAVASCLAVLAAVVRPHFARALDATLAGPPRATWQLCAQFALNLSSNSAMQLAEEDDLITFSGMAELCLHPALASQGAGSSRGPLHAVVVTYGLESRHAAVRTEAVTLLARLFAPAAQSLTGVCRFACACAPLALPEQFVNALRASRRRPAATQQYSWQAVAAAVPFARAMGDEMLLAWRRVVALGISGTPFSCTLPFFVAAMASMGALEEASLAADLDPGWARPPGLTSGHRGRAAFAAFIKAYLLYCLRACVTLRAAFLEGAAGQPSEKRDGPLPWGWQTTEPIVMCAVGVCDEALTLADRFHDVGTLPTGVHFSGSEEAVEHDEDAGGVSIAEPLAEASGIFFSFARSALSAVTTAVSSAAVHLNEGSRSAAAPRADANRAPDSAWTPTAETPSRAGSPGHADQIMAPAATDSGPASVAPATLHADEGGDGWDDWPVENSDAPAMSGHADGQSVDAVAAPSHPRGLPGALVQEQPSIVASLREDSWAAGWDDFDVGMPPLAAASPATAAAAPATAAAVPAAATMPTLSAAVVLAPDVCPRGPLDGVDVAEHDDDLDVFDADGTTAILEADKRPHPSIKNSGAAGSDHAIGTNQTAHQVGPHSSGAVSPSLSDISAPAPILPLVDGWGDLDWNPLPGGDAAVTDSSTHSRPDVAAALSAVPKPTHTVKIPSDTEALDALDWDALDVAIPLPDAAGFAAACLNSTARVASVLPAVTSAPVVHCALPVPQLPVAQGDPPPALEAMLDWDALDSAIPLPDLATW